MTLKWFRVHQNLENKNKDSNEFEDFDEIATKIYGGLCFQVAGIWVGWCF